jgi:hypothetical protein
MQPEIIQKSSPDSTPDFRNRPLQILFRLRQVSATFTPKGSSGASVSGLCVFVNLDKKPFRPFSHCVSRKTQTIKAWAVFLKYHPPTA